MNDMINANWINHEVGCFCLTYSQVMQFNYLLSNTLLLGVVPLQAAIRPPTFVFFVNDAKLFPQAYCRYMERQLRADAGFSGTPIRLLWRSRRVGKDEGKAQESK
ncbi:hypothetical protein Ahy_B09g098663 isoform C [Arachis hypogaea]|uniref:GTPase Der C-terminal KH-domain-like domain-containing protein n=1 Tax=Arachis hypogaea TaxID=3818 RepID=A0A444XSH5_ARAHY|nr:hypothetical protein Ahy_B09g098663 isoform C [Arachis hypogaea]